MIWAVPLVFVVAGVVLGVVLSRKRRWGWFWGIVTAVVALAGWLYLKAQGQSNGWDALAIFIPVVMAMAPVALGVLIGGALVRLGVVKG